MQYSGEALESLFKQYNMVKTYSVEFPRMDHFITGGVSRFEVLEDMISLNAGKDDFTEQYQARVFGETPEKAIDNMLDCFIQRNGFHDLVITIEGLQNNFWRKLARKKTSDEHVSLLGHVRLLLDVRARSSYEYDLKEIPSTIICTSISPADSFYSVYDGVFKSGTFSIVQNKIDNAYITREKFSVNQKKYVLEIEAAGRSYTFHPTDDVDDNGRLPYGISNVMLFIDKKSAENAVREIEKGLSLDPFTHENNQTVSEH